MESAGVQVSIVCGPRTAHGAPIVAHAHCHILEAGWRELPTTRHQSRRWGRPGLSARQPGSNCDRDACQPFGDLRSPYYQLPLRASGSLDPD
jgi:hypothetical protein